MEQNVNGKKQIGMMVKGLLPFYLFTFLLLLSSCLGSNKWW